MFPSTCLSNCGKIRVQNFGLIHVVSVGFGLGSFQVVVNGASTPLGKAAILAITKSRGMELGGAVDTSFAGVDAGELAGLDEPLELPICSDLVMVLGSLSQGSSRGVMVDFGTSSNILENVRQATAFGLRSVVAAENIDIEKVAALSTFCAKASMGCLVAPTLSIASVLLQQAAASAAFHYRSVEIVEARQNSSEFPSREAAMLAESISGLGQRFNTKDESIEAPARGAVVGDGVRIHSLSLPGIGARTSIHFSAPGEVLSFQHDMTDVQACMPGLLIAIRRVLKLQSLVYGLEKVL
ncbi:hypothetical protein L7F22_002697 [Adiantum nelumboides]|nr:hypothetical protein [Adiantum nelumboides]